MWCIGLRGWGGKGEYDRRSVVVGVGGSDSSGVGGGGDAGV